MLNAHGGQDIFDSFSKSSKGMSVSETAKSLSKLNLGNDFSEELLVAGVNSENLVGNLNDVSTSMNNFQSTGSSALGGIGAVIAAHPIATIGTAAVAGVTLAYNAYKNYKQNLIDTATEGATAWENQNSTLETQKQKYIELKNLLDSGTLDESETYDIKIQILDIQNQIVRTYGDEASNLDLVNGQLSNQLSLLGQISETEARKNIIHNRSAYKDAEEAMTTDRDYQLGHLGLNPEEGGVTKDIFSIAQQHEEDGIVLKDDGTGVYTIHFEGDASQAQEAIDSFMLDTDELMEKYKDDENATNFIEGILGFSVKAYDENQEILDNYLENYKSFLEMDMVAQGSGENDPATIYKNFADAVDNYNEAVADGDSTKIDETTAALENAQTARDNLLNSDDGEKYGLLFDDIDSPLDKLEETEDIGDKEVSVDIEAKDNASDVINSVSETEIAEKIAQLTGTDDATPYIALWNIMSADPKFSQLSAEDQASLVLATYNGLDPEDKNSLITEQGGAMTQGVADAVSNAISSIPVTRNSTITITTIKETINKVVSSVGKALDHGGELLRGSYGGAKLLHGTANAAGTAYANGYWGNPVSGHKLVGELGPEIVVNPYTSRWHTVGDKGPEFANVPKNAIVFNHLQTASLLKHGFNLNNKNAL